MAARQRAKFTSVSRAAVASDLTPERRWRIVLARDRRYDGEHVPGRALHEHERPRQRHDLAPRVGPESRNEDVSPVIAADNAYADHG